MSAAGEAELSRDPKGAAPRDFEQADMRPFPFVCSYKEADE